MKCKTAHKKLTHYFNNELSVAEDEAIKNHLKNCENCYNLYSELKTTYNLIEKKETLKPNPFLYTRINQQLINIKNKENQPVFIPAYRKVLQTVLLSFVILIAVGAGIKLGSLSGIQQEEKILVSPTTEFYFNDLGQEKIEVFLLNE
ncbi:MAG: zf-HC2 domain-containing protein [Bacteroidota bacterium]|nr:zf-HC2 domain-containing protein [Bacteroidota bacterium]